MATELVTYRKRMMLAGGDSDDFSSWIGRLFPPKRKEKKEFWGFAFEIFYARPSSPTAGQKRAVKNFWGFPAAGRAAPLPLPGSSIGLL